MANSTTVYALADGRRAVNVTENKTLDATDQGIVQNVISDAITVTLPLSTAGATYVIRNGGAKITGVPVGATSGNKSVLVTVAVASGDGFTGNKFTAAADKAALNTKATASIGDEIQVHGSGTNSAVAWKFGRVRGIWARQA